MDNHWFSLRKFRKVWFELNSLSKSPKPVSDTYLAMYLATLKNEKHSVFLVTGDIPISNGDCWLAYDTPYITDTPITIPTTTKLGGNTVREGEEGLTKQQIVRLRREEFLKTLEKKNNEGSGGAGTSGSSAGPSAKGSNSLAK